MNFVHPTNVVKMSDVVSVATALVGRAFESPLMWCVVGLCDDEIDNWSVVPSDVRHRLSVAIVARWRWWTEFAIYPPLLCFDKNCRCGDTQWGRELSLEVVRLQTDAVKRYGGRYFPSDLRAVFNEKFLSMVVLSALCRAKRARLPYVHLSDALGPGKSVAQCGEVNGTLRRYGIAEEEKFASEVSSKLKHGVVLRKGRGEKRQRKISAEE